MQALGTDLMLVCSNVSPARARRHRPRRRRFPRAWRTGGRARACASATRRSPGGATSTTTATPGRSSAGPTTRTIGLILDCFHTLARRHRRRLDPRDPRRPDLPRAARRRAADRHGPALLEPPLPQHARPGRPAGRRTSCARSRRPAMTASSRWRSSTTSSAAARRSRSRSTAGAR